MKTSTYKASLILTALLTILSSCQKEAVCVGEENPADTVEKTQGTIRLKSVALSGSGQSTVTNAGLFIGEPVNAANVLLKISTDGTVTPSVKLDWAKGQTKNSDFVAYSPYDSTYRQRTAVNFGIKADQSSQEAFVSSDLLVAKTLAKPSDDAVTLEFHHKLSQIVVYFDNRTEYLIEKVEFLKMPSDVVLDLETGDVSGGRNSADLTAFKDPADDCFRLVVPAGTNDFNMRITLSNGLTLSRIAKDVTLQEGKFYDNSSEPIVLEDVKAKAISLNFAVSDWVDGGQLSFNRGAGGYDSVADLTSTATSEDRDFTAYVKDLKITYVYPNGNKAFAQDASGGVLLYGDCRTLDGQYTGQISGTICLYTGCPEIKNLNVNYAQHSQLSAMPVAYVTLKELSESFDRYIGCRVCIDGVTITKGIDIGSSAVRTGEVEQDGTTMLIYNDSNTAVLNAGFKGSLTAYPHLYNGTQELYVCESDWFVGESALASAFRKETVPGVYRISGESCESIISLSPNVQTNFGVRTGYMNSFFFDRTQNRSVFFSIEADNLIAGNSFNVTASTTGNPLIDSGANQYTALKQDGNTIWLYCEQTGIGIIINK